MAVLVRRRPLLRVAAIAGGAYYVARRRQDSRNREQDERDRVAALDALRRRSAGASANR